MKYRWSKWATPETVGASLLTKSTKRRYRSTCSNTNRPSVSISGGRILLTVHIKLRSCGPHPSWKKWKIRKTRHHSVSSWARQIPSAALSTKSRRGEEIRNWGLSRLRKIKSSPLTSYSRKRRKRRAYPWSLTSRSTCLRAVSSSLRIWRPPTMSNIRSTLSSWTPCLTRI